MICLFLFQKLSKATAAGYLAQSVSVERASWIASNLLWNPPSLRDAGGYWAVRGLLNLI